MSVLQAMPLLRLLTDARLAAADILGNPDVVVTGISTHAQRTQRNQMFVAMAGTRIDSHMLLSDAVSRGASVLLVERDIPPYPGVTIVRVPDARYALGRLVQAFHGNPARAMTFVCTTGTDGKSSVSSLVERLMRRAGRRPALVGTLGASWGGRFVDTSVTTPDSMALAAMLSEMERDRVDLVSMEVSSHGIDQSRIAGIPVHVGILTCVTGDHLDYHGSFENYANVKRRLFFDYVAPTPGSLAVFNADDPVGDELSESYIGDFVTFSRQGEGSAGLRARDIRCQPEGTTFKLEIAGSETIDIRTPLIGDFNVSNLLAAIAAVRGLGMDPREAAAIIPDLGPVAGRFERVEEGQPFLTVVDYAHTADALEKVLRTARRLITGNLITVFGCGGDRDKSKRAPMGRAAGRNSDHVIITSDNPRSEDPALIARMAVEGVLGSGLKPGCHQVILDRRQAIERALTLAKPGDCVMIAGKGHETYQDIDGTRYEFDDRATARELLGPIARNFQANPARPENAGAVTA